VNAAGLRAEAHGAGRTLRIQARRDVSSLLAGGWSSGFRGRGLAFEELREYEPGDDASLIEWNATARLGRPIAKRMREERDLAVALLVDESESMVHGRDASSKFWAARRAAAALAVAATRARDRVALATFGARIHTALEPDGHARQLERILRLLEVPRARDDEQGRGASHTDLTPVLEWAIDRLPRHSVVIAISDLLCPHPGGLLAHCARKHDVIALRLGDPADALPRRTAPVRVQGAEDGVRSLWRSRGRAAQRARIPGGLTDAELRSAGVEVGQLLAGDDLLGTLHRFFGDRGRRRA